MILLKLYNVFPRWPMTGTNTDTSPLPRMPRATVIPFARPLSSFTSKELFAELSRVELLVENCNDTIDKLLDSGECGCTADLLLAAQIQEYKIRQESYIARIRQHILATRK